MGKMIRVVHMGNSYDMHISYALNAELGSYTVPFSQYADALYDHFMTDAIANQWVWLWGSNPWGAVPNNEHYYQEFGAAHYDQAWNVDVLQWSAYAPNRKIQVLNNNKFVNPDNGRYFTFTGTTGNPSFHVFDENDIEVGNGQFLLSSAWTLYGIQDIHAFITANTLADAITAGGCYKAVVSLDVRNSNVRITVSQQTSANSPAFFGLLWYFMGGDDTSYDPSSDPYSGDDSPYNPGDVGGGDGDQEDPYDPGDDIDYPDDPDIGLTDTKLLSLYTPSAVQLNLLAEYLWSTDFVNSMVKDIYANPADVIVSVGIVPFEITPAGVKNVKVGDRNASVLGTVVQSNYPASEWFNFDCGSVAIKSGIGCYLDHSPYTKITVFIPFVGYVPVDTDIYMETSIGLKYKINLATGAAVAFLLAGAKVMQQFACNVKIEVPLSAANGAEMWRSFIETTVAAVPLAAGAGAGAIAGASGAGSAALLGGEATAEIGGQLGEISNRALEISKDAYNKAPSGASACSIMNSLATKPSFQKSNVHSVSGGFVASKLMPYVIIERPNLQIPKNQALYTGYPTYITRKLKDVSGYTVVDACNLSIPGATQAEYQMIESALKQGVIVKPNNYRPVSGDIHFINKISPMHQIGVEYDGYSYINGDFNMSVNILNPVIRVDLQGLRKDEFLTDYNYVFVKEFNRFYFIDNIKLVRSSIFDVVCSVDPLNSFAPEILENEVILAKQENDYNLYLNDDSLKVQQKPLISTWKFPQGFGDGYEYVMLIAGG